MRTNDITNNSTYGEFLNYWLKIYKKPYLKASSFQSILRTIKNNIPISIKDTKLKDLKVYLIDKALSNIKLSRSRKYAYYVYYNSLKRAYCLEFIENDISVKIFKVKHNTKKGVALTKQEQFNFLEKVKGSKYENAFLFILYSGLRRTELTTIKLQDIYEKDKVIKIRGTKTASAERFIPLTDKLAEIIDKQKPFAKRGLLFPYHADTLTHYFKKYCPNHHLHELRHTYITRCAESGINIKVTQKLVGHKTLDTTLNIYTTIEKNFISEEVKKLKI